MLMVCVAICLLSGSVLKISAWIWDKGGLEKAGNDIGDTVTNVAHDIQHSDVGQFVEHQVYDPTKQWVEGAINTAGDLKGYIRSVIMAEVKKIEATM
jgi:hypothetical protein